MKREQVLLLITVVVLALMTWGLLDGDAGPTRVRSASRRLDLAELPAADLVLRMDARGGDRDPYREPREEEPLPPLQLPLPELGELAVLLPPPIPDSGPEHWTAALLVEAPVPVGGIQDLLEVSEEVGLGEDAVELPEPDAGQQPEDPDYGLVYDSVRLNPFTVLYGRLLGEDRYDKRPGDAILFQEVDPRSGRDRFAPQPLAGDAYEAFRFAETLRNQIELRWRALSRSPAAIPERIALIDWLLEQGDREPVAFEHAERLAREGVRLVADDPETWMTLGRVWEATFRLDQAFALYSRLSGRELEVALPEGMGIEVPAGRFRQYQAPLVGMARVLRRLGLDQEAEAPLREAVSLDGLEAPLALGVLLLETGRPAEALPLLERGRILPRSSPLAVRNSVAIGRAQLMLGQWAEAEAGFRDADRAAGAIADLPTADAAAARSGMAAARYLAGDFAAAAEIAAQAVEDLGPEPVLLYMRGITVAATGGAAAEAVRDLRAAARAERLGSAPAHAALAFWLDVIGEAELAQQELEEALALAPELPYASYLLGAWSRRAGDLQSASVHLRGRIQESPGFAAGLAELGWILHREERPQLAEVALRRAQAEAPDLPQIVARRAFNLLVLEDFDGAQAGLARALELDPGLHAARNARAWAAYAEGDLVGAVAEFGELQDRLRDQEEEPQFRYAQQWQQRIEEHARQRLWLDNFDGDLLRPQWDAQTHARLGVEPRVGEGVLRVTGLHTGAGRTRVSRDLTAIRFKSFAATLIVGGEEAHKGDSGVFLALESARGGRQTWLFEVVRDREGALSWNLEQGSRREGGALGMNLPEEVPGEIGFELNREETPPVLTVTVMGNVVYQEKVPQLRSPSGNMAVGMFAGTRNALPVDVRLDGVKLIYSQS